MAMTETVDQNKSDVPAKSALLPLKVSIHGMDGQASPNQPRHARKIEKFLGPDSRPETLNWKKNKVMKQEVSRTFTKTWQTFSLNWSFSSFHPNISEKYGHPETLALRN